ncbi:MAG TPA: cyclic pyranopterin monophosphate synthase MoaC [Solirubrobacteraceae bacterium]|jgi:cyclic pyranopterin phosphate synthase|nr:cyclic pyranopterin monophosphate synthase MoaC [Solirubrobacteraceae bacterium]
MTDRGLTHLDESGRARMVDVGAKPATERRAVARALVRMATPTAEAVAAGDAPKGDVLATARIAGIQAAKRTAELIPLAHPLPLGFIDVRAQVAPAQGIVTLEAEARTVAQTGVELEAMCACAVAALTVYDMVKGLERGVSVERVELVAKTGGRHDWARRG